jgi:hypothetical protein
MTLITFGCLAVTMFFVLSLVVLGHKKLKRLERVVNLTFCFLGEVAGVYGVAHGVVFG